MENKFNKDFEDFGWSEMQKMLDRELPVADNKRRRGLVFWLFLIGCLTALGVYEFNTNHSVENKNSNSVVINNELKSDNSNSINNENKNNNSVVTNNELKNDNSNSINNKNKNNNSVVINNELKSDNSSSINNKNKNNNSVVINNRNISPQYFNEKLSHNDAIDATQGTLIITEQVFTLNNKPLKEIKSDSMVINDLKGINPLTKYALIKPIFTSKTHWGVTTGIHTEGSKIMDGWQLGFVINRQFKPKLSLSTGLNYRQTKVNGNVPLTYYQVELKGAYTSQSALVPAKRIVLNKLNYSELPFAINYHFNNKWSISTGIKTAYLMGAGIMTSSDSTLFVLQNGNNSKLDASLLSADQSSNVTALGLQRWDFAAIGGLNFKPTKRLELSLRYDFGLKNVLNQANWSAYNRFIGLNATYYFK